MDLIVTQITEELVYKTLAKKTFMNLQQIQTNQGSHDLVIDTLNLVVVNIKLSCQKRNILRYFIQILVAASNYVSLQIYL